MEDILSLLNNRERAALFWIAFVLLLALGSKPLRSSALSIAKTLFARQILVVLGSMVGYVSLVVFISHQLGLWNLGMVKETVIWFFGPALVMVFNYNQANKDASFFKKTVVASLKILVALEFLINFYVLHIAIEIVLVPILVALGALLAYSETSEEYTSVKRPMEYLMAVFGLSLLAYAVTRLIVDFESFASVDTLRLFALPIVLTLLFLPFVYALAVYTAYEAIFVRIRLWITDTELAHYTRRQVLRACLFRLSRVNRFANEYAVRLSTVKSQPDAAKLISDFRGP